MSIIPYLSDFDKPFRMMERDFFHRPEEFFGVSPFNHLIHRDFYTPLFRENVFRPWKNYFRPIEELATKMNQIGMNELGSKIVADDKKFQVNVDVQHFAPEEVKVKVTDGDVVIEGKHEEKVDPHGYVSRQFFRRYKLPEECVPDTVESKLSSDGVLTVTAPKVLPLPSTGERIVPIAHGGPVKKQIGWLGDPKRH